MTKALDAALEAVSNIGKPEVVVQHAPTPYHIESVATSAYSARVFICDATGARVTDINCGDDDEKFIVRAVNSFDNFIKACNMSLDEIKKGGNRESTIKFLEKTLREVQ